MQYIVLNIINKGDASQIGNLDFESPFIEWIALGKGDDEKGKDKEKGKDGEGKDKSFPGHDKDKDKDKDKGKDKEKDKDKDKDKDKGKGEGEWPRPYQSVFKTHMQAAEPLWVGGTERVGKKKAKVVIVCRNPKDALLSMWKQEKTNMEYDGTFDE